MSSIVLMCLIDSSNGIMLERNAVAAASEEWIRRNFRAGILCFFAFDIMACDITQHAEESIMIVPSGLKTGTSLPHLGALSYHE
mmetsp:Transcript_2882/g.8101  ORF Transcript_2882/g.8101 Transcript_2882/m.8101 type:complete len:84 (-) Transcript_2882:966-1217(-)